MPNPEYYNEVKNKSNHSLKESTKYHYNAVINCQTFRENENILDYACGTGIFCKEYLLEIATKNNSKLVGVDISKAMQEYAVANSFEPGITEYFVGNILDDSTWPFQAQAFDKVFANLMMHVFQDYTSVFAKFNQCLKPGGTLAATIPTTSILKILVELANTKPFWKNHYTKGGSEYFSSWSSTDPYKGEHLTFEPALFLTGFKVKEYAHKYYQLEFENVYEGLSYIITANGPLSALPTDSELYRKLQLDLIEVMELMGINTIAKPFVFDYHMYHFVAEKL